MKQFTEFLTAIENPDNRDKLSHILEWIYQEFPRLEPVIKWNQPMFIAHGTYIIVRPSISRLPRKLRG